MYLIVSSLKCYLLQQGCAAALCNHSHYQSQQTTCDQLVCSVINKNDSGWGGK